MLLSEAIRKGMKKTRHTTDQLGRYENGRAVACALGAAAVGYGRKVGSGVSTKMCKYVNWVVEVPAADTSYSTSLADAIIYLNDSYGWNRGRIAKFVEKQEKLWELKK